MHTINWELCKVINHSTNIRSEQKDSFEAHSKKKLFRFCLNAMLLYEDELFKCKRCNTFS